MRAFALLIALLVLAVAPAAQAGGGHHHGHGHNGQNGKDVTVMTRNVYLGGNIFAPLAAKTPEEFLALAGDLWEEVQTTDFPTRAPLIAREIDRTDPDLIGLQEVALWRRGPDGVLDGPATPSEQVVYDFLDILTDALRERGLRYEVATVQTEADLEAPTDAGYDVRLTMHDVILVRKGHGIHVRDSAGANYATELAIPTPVGPLVSKRGWTAVDVSKHGKRFRFVNTHLEAAADPIRDAQAAELVAPTGPVATTTKPVILVGDINSDPNGTESTSGAVDILEAAGLTDVWPLIEPDDPGFSCCLESSDLSDTTTAGFDHRIDLILTKPVLSGRWGAVVGDELDDRAPNGLWPSDHAGVVVELKPR